MKKLLKSCVAVAISLLTAAQFVLPTYAIEDEITISEATAIRVEVSGDGEVQVTSDNVEQTVTKEEALIVDAYAGDTLHFDVKQQEVSLLDFQLDGVTLSDFTADTNEFSYDYVVTESDATFQISFDTLSETDQSGVSTEKEAAKDDDVGEEVSSEEERVVSDSSEDLDRDPSYNAEVLSETVDETNLSKLEETDEHSVYVKYLLVDPSKIDDSVSSIEQIMMQDNLPIYTNIAENATVYKTENGQYKVKTELPYINQLAIDDPMLAEFARGNDYGDAVIEGVSYDPTSHIATMTEDAFTDISKDDFADIQLQVVIPINAENDVHPLISVDNQNKGTDVVAHDSVSVRPFMTTRFPLVSEKTADSISAKEIEVTINGTDVLTSEEFAYDQDTGYLGIKRIGANISSIDVTIHKKSLISTFAAGIGYGNQDVGQYGVVAYLADGTDPNSFAIGDSEEHRGKFGHNSWPAVPANGPTELYNASYNNVTPPNGDGNQVYRVDSQWGVPTSAFGEDFTFRRSDGSAYPLWEAGFNSPISAWCHHAQGLTLISDSNVYEFGHPWSTLRVLDKQTIGGLTHVVFGFETNKRQFDIQTNGAVFELAFKSAGKLSITKKSSNTGISSGNSLYSSMEGAEYGLYSNSSATDLVGTFTIKADGSSNTIDNLSIGTYYIKETKAPSGYALDTTIHKVQVSSGDTVWTANDVPQADPVSILLRKVDSETGKAVPQGSASLAGAEYTVKYYDGYYSKASELNGKTPKKTWVLKTDSDGYAILANSYKVSGDDLYLNGDGVPTLPLGTISIQETKAPTGYKLNSELYIRQITSDGNLAVVSTYNEPTIPEDVIKGKIRVAKKDKDTGKVIQIAGTQFDIYFNDQKVDTIKTDSTGYATSKELPYGRYVVKETKAPTGYVVDLNQQATVNITAEKTYDTELLDKRVLGTINLVKEDSETAGRPQGDATLKGAEYGLYAAENITDPSNDGAVLYQKGELVDTFITDEDGNASINELYLGQYTVKETKASVGYEIDPTEYAVTLSYKDDRTATVTVGKTSKEEIRTGQFEIVKFMTPAYESEIVTNEEGAEFTVVLAKDYEANGKDIKAALDYAKENRSEKEYAVLTTDKDGRAVSPELAYGRYVIQQTKKGTDASETDMLEGVFYFEVAETEQNGETYVKGEDNKGNQMTMSSDGKMHYHINNRPHDYYVQILKKDADTGKTVTLNNASFQIVKTDEDGNPVANYNNGTVRTDENGIVSIKSGLLWYDTFYTNAENRLSIIEHITNWEAPQTEQLGTVTVPVKLPSGDYSVSEIKTPEGYLLGKDMNFSLNEEEVNMTDQDGDAYLTIEFADPKPTGKIELTKVFEDPDTILHGEVTFDLYVVEDIVDPADGSILYHAGDLYDTYTLDETTNTIVIEDLPMGIGESHFKLVEKTTYENYKLNQKEYFVDFEQTDDTTTVYTQEVTVENETIKIKTTALNAKTEDKEFNSAEKITVTDIVEYDGVLVNHEYTMTGTLMDAETGEPVLNADGTTVTGSTTFTPESETGTVEVTMTLDASQIGGKDFVVYESLYNTGWGGHENCEVAKHHDLTDEDQTITVLNSQIRTLAASMNGTHEQQISDGEITITDEVEYENIVPGLDYKVKGKLVNQETGETIVDAQGNEVTSETTFKAEEHSGTVELSFTFDASNIEAGMDLVAFETLYELNTTEDGSVEEIKVAEHEDLDDENQTIHFIDLQTEATSQNGSQEQQETESEVTLTDTVTYQNLRVGETYVLKGILMNKETNEPLLDQDGNQITAETEFVPETEDGTVEVVFTFDMTGIEAGTDMVVFESLYHDDVEIGVHTDIDDESQTVHVIDIHTTARTENGTQEQQIGEGEITFTDAVAYENLRIGEEYTVSGTLMDKESGESLKDAEGNPITGETTFTPETEDGVVNVTFTFDMSELEAGQDMVVFESLKHHDIEVAVHEDLEDENQTIHFIDFQTEATSQNGSQEQQETESEVTLTDTVTYQNLRVGETYVLKGILMNKETNEPLLDQDGNQITAETEFVPETEDGTVEVVFTFDMTGIEAGTDMVVFESLYHDDVEIGVHTDIDDESQTVHVIDIHTSAITDNESDDVQIGDKEITLTDTVTYEHLQVGEEYRLEGVLMDKTTGEPLLVDGEKVRSEATFTPEETDGTVDVVFTFNIKELTAGTNIVVFETLYHDDFEVAVHEDLEDLEQTIQLIDLKTTAQSENDTHTALAGEEIVITDVVTYTNLEPGKTYTVKGKLMDKETGEPLLIDEKEVTAETTFVPEEPNGSVNLIYTLDASELEGKTVVVFEDLYKDDKLVGTHSDLEDEDQTITFKDYEIVIQKIDSATGKPITSGFEFTVYSDADCKEALETLKPNENGQIQLAVEKGTVYIKETKAPEGYLLSDEIVKVEVKDDILFVNDQEVEVNEDYIYSFNYENTPEPDDDVDTSTQTGAKIFVTALCASGIGALGLTAYNRKKRNKKA